ncbi:MAG: hypothetical protein ABSG92_09570 [Conexivisphaerales archaeon]
MTIGQRQMTKLPFSLEDTEFVVKGNDGTHFIPDPMVMEVAAKGLTWAIGFPRTCEGPVHMGILTWYTWMEHERSSRNHHEEWVGGAFGPQHVMTEVK